MSPKSACPPFFLGFRHIVSFPGCPRSFFMTTFRVLLPPPRRANYVLPFPKPFPGALRCVICDQAMGLFIARRAHDSYGSMLEPRSGMTFCGLIRNLVSVSMVFLACNLPVLLRSLIQFLTDLTCLFFFFRFSDVTASKPRPAEQALASQAHQPALLASRVYHSGAFISLSLQ